MSGIGIKFCVGSSISKNSPNSSKVEVSVLSRAFDVL